MQDEGALRAQQHASGRRAQNLASQQVPAAYTTERQVRRMDRILTDLNGYSPYEAAFDGVRDQVGAQLPPEGNRIIGTTRESDPPHTAVENLPHFLLNKRQRLSAQPQSASSTDTEAIYNFVPLPAHVPGVDQAEMPPPLMSTTSPQISADHGNKTVRHTTTQPAMPRGQSSPGNMVLQQQHSARPRPATTTTTGALTNLARPPSATGCSPSNMLLDRLHSAMADPHLASKLTKGLGRQRLQLLESACQSTDWVFLTLHQIYCWQVTYDDRSAMHMLGDSGTRYAELGNFHHLLMSNTDLSFTACDWFSNFPTDRESLRQGSNPEALHALPFIHKILDRMSVQWQPLQASCIRRRFPPAPYELYEILGMHSTVLQELCFTHVLKKIEDQRDQKWFERAIRLFAFTQKQLIDKIGRLINGLPEAPLQMRSEVAQFANEYFDLRRQNANGPGGSAVNGQNIAQPPATLASQSIFAPRLAVKDVPSRTPNHGVPLMRKPQAPNYRLVPGVPNEVGRNAMKRPASVPQLETTNNTQPTIGQSHRSFMQEALGVDGRTPSSFHATAGISADGHPPEPALTSPTSRPITFSNGVSVRHQGSYTVQGITLLLPPAGKLMSLSINPSPDLLALHQARLSTPEPQVEGMLKGIQRLFLVFRRFLLTPKLIKKEQSYYSWQVDLPAVDEFRTARDLLDREPVGLETPETKRDYLPGSFIYRLRCIKVTSELREADWAVAPTFWPSSCFISVEGNEIEIRRKSHWGKHLPCDLTRKMKAGLNLIEMSVHSLSEGMPGTYAVAIELIEVLDHEQCTKSVKLIEVPASLAAIVASLKTIGDPDISIVDPYISIDITDPSTKSMWKTPVRGTTCMHRECFDLETFLDSRFTKHQGFPLSSADHWKCPICNKDARPHCLVLDGFLLSVSKQLRRGSDEEETVRAIRVTADGSWKPVQAEKNATRREPSVTDELVNMTRAQSTPNPNESKENVLTDILQGESVVKERVVIDLIDSDDD